MQSQAWKAKHEQIIGALSDLQHDHKEKVDIGHSVELFKQRHGQESQKGVLVAAHQIVLATEKKMNTESVSRET